MPPESPRFISLPELPQSSEHKPTPVKGVLPVPRQIFTKRAHMAHKLQPTFVEDTAPKSRSEKLGLAPKSEKDGWRRLMAESRRQALGSGIKSLWRRKQYRDARANRRAEAHKARNIADATAPERPDEVFTRATITAATLETKVIRDPAYDEKKRLSQARTAAVAQIKSEARKDAIQRLYVQATNFILSEAELAERVERLFTEDYFEKIKGKGQHMGGPPHNAWDAHRAPPSVKELLAEQAQVSSKLTTVMKDADSKTLERQKMVAGELTGGALSVGGGLVDVEEKEKGGPTDEVTRQFVSDISALSEGFAGAGSASASQIAQQEQVPDPRDVVTEFDESYAEQMSRQQQSVLSVSQLAEQSAQRAKQSSEEAIQDPVEQAEQNDKKTK